MKPRTSTRLIINLILSLSIFVAFVVWIESAFQWSTILSMWKHLPISLTAIAFSLFSISYLLRSVRLWICFDELRGISGIVISIKVMFIHNFFNNLLPMRTGEAAFPLLLKKQAGIEFSRSLPALLVFRFLDLMFLLIVASFVVVGDLYLPLRMLLAMAVFLVPFVLWLLHHRLKMEIAKQQGRISDLLLKLISGIPERFSVFCQVYFWTIMNWSIKLLLFAFMLQQFADIPYTSALLGSMTGELSSVLPIHGFAGAGTYETGIAFGLVVHGISLSQAVIAGTNLHLFILSTTIVLGFIGWIIPSRTIER